MIFNLFRSRKQLEDHELIARYKKTGQAKYVAELYRRYSQLISGLCYKHLGQHDAEDAAMDVFEIMCRDLHSHEVRKVGNWLYSVTRHHCLKIIKQNRRQVAHEDMSDKFSAHFMENDEPDALLEKEELEIQLDSLTESLVALSPEQRECVEMFYLKKLSYQEISDATGYDLKKVKSYIQNGKRKLKIEMEKRIEH